MEIKKTNDIKAIIGLGNPGSQYYYQRHNIGFCILDVLADEYNGVWSKREPMEYSDVMIGDKKVLLVKPQTFMNASGKVIPWLLKQGIKPEHMLVIHDELEKPFGHISVRFGGSARGHNGLRSIISVCGPEFMRLRFGIGRPELKEEVGNYVLQKFSESPEEVEQLIHQAVETIVALFNHQQHAS